METMNKIPDVIKEIVWCAIYSRVSTDQQAELEFSSSQAQEDRIRSFIASQDGFKVFKVYTDDGYTGANTDRPGMQEMLRDIAAGKIGMVLTYKIDRLTRSPRDFYELIEHFEKHNAGFISVTERFDTSTPAGRLLRNIMLTFGQFERELISERVKDKVTQRVKRGLHTGGTPPYGYKTEKGALVLDEPRDQHVKFVFETYAKTRSLRAVLRAFKERGILTRQEKPFYDSVIWHMLRSPIYTGMVMHHKKAYPGKHTPIISADLFGHVQKIITETPRRPPNPENRLPFAGIIRCEECGSCMTLAYTNKMNKSGMRKYFYYRCSKATHQGTDACSTRQIGAERLHEFVYKNLVRISLDEEYLKNLVFTLQNQTNSEPGMGLEPRQDFYNLTPEILQKDLKAYVKTCARKTGFEKALAVRRGLRSLHYSKKSIRVEYVVGAVLSESPGRGTCRRAADAALPLDGKRPIDCDSSASALRADHKMNPSNLSVGFGGGTTTEGDDRAAAGKAKEPDRLERSDSFVRFAPSDNGDVFKIHKTVVSFIFPNIHNYWKNYRLTGEYYISPTRKTVG